MSFGQVVTSVGKLTSRLLVLERGIQASGQFVMLGGQGGSPPPALLTYTVNSLQGNVPSKSSTLFLHNNCGPCNIVLANEVEVEITVWFS